MVQIERDEGYVKGLKAENATVELRIRRDEEHFGGDTYMDLIIDGEVFTLKGAYTIYDKERRYDPEFGDERRCGCGHPYRRHFDPYENNDPVGCKYCPCGIWHEKPTPEEQEQYDEEIRRDALREAHWAEEERKRTEVAAAETARLEALDSSEEHD